MKLQIEKWVEEIEPFNNQAKDLFEESVKCYKIGAYKSAFIMSYLAFKITIRVRIMDCMYRPEGFTEENWNNIILKRLEDDDEWEKQVNEIVVASSDSKKCIIHFINREQVKIDYNHWKEARNICAHAKQNRIDSSTVECFWNYLQDNLSKFYVLGGKVYLISELFKYYKYLNFEKNDQKKKRLLYDVKTVYAGKTDEFFIEFFKKISSINLMIVDEDNVEFWRDIILSSYEDIKDGIIKAICENEYYFTRFYNFFPEILELALGVDSKFIVDKLST